MNRRSFLQKAAAGLFGLAVAAHLPMNYLPESVKVHGALAYLNKIFNNFVKEQGRLPVAITVSPELFTVFESELQVNQRFTFKDLEAKGRPNLAFKMCAVTYHEGFKGYDYGIG